MKTYALSLHELLSSQVCHGSAAQQQATGSRITAWRRLACRVYLVDNTGASRLTLDSTNYLSLDLGSLLQNKLLSDTNTYQHSDSRNAILPRERHVLLMKPKIVQATRVDCPKNSCSLSIKDHLLMLQSEFASEPRLKCPNMNWIQLFWEEVGIRVQ